MPILIAWHKMCSTLFMGIFLTMLFILNLPNSAFANHSCAQLFYKNTSLTINEGLSQGLLLTTLKLGDLRDHEVTEIQSIVDAFGKDIYVVGSAAVGRRRNVDTLLPLAVFGGSKSNTKSDIDYVVKTGFGDEASLLPLPDMDSSWGVREVDYISFSNTAIVRFRPNSDPICIQGSGRFLLDE